jgi:hypothetical protein
MPARTVCCLGLLTGAAATYELGLAASRMVKRNLGGEGMGQGDWREGLVMHLKPDGKPGLRSARSLIARPPSARPRLHSIMARTAPEPPGRPSADGKDGQDLIALPGRTG